MVIHETVQISSRSPRPAARSRCVGHRRQVASRYSAAMDHKIGSQGTNTEMGGAGRVIYIRQMAAIICAEIKRRKDLLTTPRRRAFACVLDAL